MQQENFISRFWKLVSGAFGRKLDKAELRNAAVIYNNAIGAQQSQERKLKAALGQLVQLRNRAEADLQNISEDLRLLQSALERAALDSDEEQGIKLIEKRHELETRETRAQAQREELTGRIKAAQASMAESYASIEKLRRERTEFLARKAHAEAQLRIQELSRTSSPSHTDTAAVERVREAVEELESVASIEPHLEVDGSQEISLRLLRKEHANETATTEFRELQQRMNGRLLSSMPARPARIELMATGMEEALLS
jgi:phage shock protein A